ncbi:MAG: TIR domain-containing protein [Anaerolineae bacterium]|nr:TIR domain-containing protein [Anaerolineae bacterium]MBN8617866.1 TIR domain-containing protein [Anaerolineae bacterium]
MKIFISYAHEDTARILEFQQALEIHDVWFDHRLSIGQEWWAEIERQISASHCFLLLLSPRSLDSEYCQKELALALRLDKPIAPVMITEMAIPEQLGKYQVINLTGELNAEGTAKLLNGLFEIEREVFNPLKAGRNSSRETFRSKMSIHDLHFATTNPQKKRMYEQLLNTELQTTALHLDDIQHIDAGEVALHKAEKAYAILKKPVFVDHSSLAVRAWGGFPGGLTTCFYVPVGLHNVCRMLQPFEDKYAESISVIAFEDGSLRRKFVSSVAGRIADQPRGNGYSWNNIFIPAGFDQTLGEMSEEEVLSLSSRRRAMIEFMRFLQSNYDFQ